MRNEFSGITSVTFSNPDFKIHQIFKSYASLGLLPEVTLRQCK